MISKAEKIYIFEEFRLEPDKRILHRTNGSDEQIRLANRPFQVLLYLVENRDRFVAREELLDKFWDGRDVYDTALTKAVGAVRKALNEPPENPRFIETRWAEGYRFIGKVEEQPVYLEIERTREVSIIFEEDSEPTAARDELSGVGDKSKITNLKLPGKSRVLTRGRVAAFAFVVLALVGLYALTRPSPVKPVPSNSIAVLPLKNLSGNQERDIFVDAMTESLISSLSKIKGLKVISRNSSFMFKDKPAAPPEIAERLGVATYLEGSFRESGDKIRVEVRLVNAENGEILWSGGDYEKVLGDVFEIQDDIARSVATELRLKLSSAEEKLVAKRQTNNFEAYQNYVKGRYFWKKKTPEDLEKARKFLETAIALDPNYALAYAGLADYYLTGVWYADFPPAEATEKAKSLVAKALELDDESAEAHRLRAKMAQGDWDWGTSRRETEKAIELNPNEANYWQGYAFILRNFDRNFDEAVAAMRRAAALDPLSPSINTDLGVMLTHAGQTDEAIETLRKIIETEPQFLDAYWNLALAYERKGDFDNALAAQIELERLKGRSPEKLALYRVAYEQDGMKGFCRKRMEFQLEDSGEKNFPAFVRAAVSAYLGEKDAAFEWLEKSYAAREPYMVNLKSEFSFDELRSDARFIDLVRRVGFEK